MLTLDLKEIKAGSVLEVEKLCAALLLEQGRCQEMGRVVTYLDKAKESLEKERVAEVAKIQEELSGKLLAEQWQEEGRAETGGPGDRAGGGQGRGVPGSFG